MNCCSHLFEIGNVTPRTPNGCEECLKMGDRWLHLRPLRNLRSRRLLRRFKEQARGKAFSFNHSPVNQIF